MVIYATWESSTDREDFESKTYQLILKDVIKLNRNLR